MALLSFKRVVRAVEKVRERLMRSTSALEQHGVPYAVVGGNAVAVWVASIDEDAVRNTADVDILLNRGDLTRAEAALAKVGFDLGEVHGVTMFIERADPSPRRAVHVVFVGEKFRPDQEYAAPDFSRAERSPDGFSVIDLVSLLVMKLNANRLKDRVHVQDMLELGLITPGVEAQLPAPLRARLDAIRTGPE